MVHLKISDCAHVAVRLTFECLWPGVMLVDDLSPARDAREAWPPAPVTTLGGASVWADVVGDKVPPWPNAGSPRLESGECLCVHGRLARARFASCSVLAD